MTIDELIAAMDKATDGGDWDECAMANVFEIWPEFRLRIDGLKLARDDAQNDTAMWRKDVENMRAEREKRIAVHNECFDYAKNLLATLAPACKPLGTLAGMLTQIDNWCAGRLTLGDAAAQRSADEPTDEYVTWHDEPQPWKPTPPIKIREPADGDGA